MNNKPNISSCGDVVKETKEERANEMEVRWRRPIEKSREGKMHGVGHNHFKKKLSTIANDTDGIYYQCTRAGVRMRGQNEDTKKKHTTIFACNSTKESIMIYYCFTKSNKRDSLACCLRVRLNFDEIVVVCMSIQSESQQN